MINLRYTVNYGPFLSFFFLFPRNRFNCNGERVHYLTDARQRKEMGEFHWLSKKVNFVRTMFAVELSTGKGRVILKDFIVTGEKGNNSGKAELAAK